MKPKVDLMGSIEAVPTELRSELSIVLMDLLLVAKDGEKVPSPLIKDLLNLWRKDELSTTRGLSLLIEAALSVDPGKVREVFLSKRLEAIAKSLGLGGS